MKKTVKIAFCGVMAAMGTAVMLLSYFPYFTYGVPALSGLVSLVVLIEIGFKWAWGTYAVIAFTAMLFAEPEAKLMFVLILGYYPILKACIERLKNKSLQYILKFAVFNCAVFAVYKVFAEVFGVYTADIGSAGTLGVVFMLMLANVTFFLYDIALVRVADFYIARFHKHISKLLKGR